MGARSVGLVAGPEARVGRPECKSGREGSVLWPVQPTSSSCSSLPRYPAAAAPASPTSTLRGTSSPARKWGRPGRGALKGDCWEPPPPCAWKHTSPAPAPQEVPGCASRAATLPQPRGDTSAPGPGGLQAAPRRAQVSVAAYGHALGLRCHHAGHASSASPCSYRTHNLPSILVLPSLYLFESWGPLSQLPPFPVTSPPRALLEGLALNTHMGDLHLDLSACEVSAEPQREQALGPHTGSGAEGAQGH